MKRKNWIESTNQEAQLINLVDSAQSSARLTRPPISHLSIFPLTLLLILRVFGQEKFIGIIPYVYTVQLIGIDIYICIALN